MYVLHAATNIGKSRRLAESGASDIAGETEILACLFISVWCSWILATHTCVYLYRIACHATTYCNCILRLRYGGNPIHSFFQLSLGM